MSKDSTSFWAVWWEGKDWPGLYSCEKMAKEAAHKEAKARVGTKVHLMKVGSVGTVLYPTEPRLSGELCAAQ